MREYRLRFYNAEGRLQRIEAINAPDDDAAIARAQIRHDRHRVEVLCGSRIVGTVPSQSD